jgi:hypothetical protein
MNVAKKYFYDVIDRMPNDIQNIDEGYDYLFMIKRHEESKKEYTLNGGISDNEMERRLQEKYAKLREGKK